MTERQKELIGDNLRAFIHNFGDVRIEQYTPDRGFYVYFPPEDETYIQYCYSIDYLDGWLYGVVQGANMKVFKK